MNAPEVRKLLDRNNYQNITMPQEGVLRAERWYLDHPIAVHYFDASRRFLSPDFRLDKYQDDLLLRDYYANPGPLQWNYYLYFLCDKDTQLDDKDRARIESNRVFARKLVVRDCELAKEISQDVVDAQSVGVPGDVTTTWRRQLESVGLGNVASRELHYTDIVRDYLASVDSVCGGSVADDKSGVDPDVTRPLDFVEKVVLDAYRGLSGREFSFKHVNLIVGPNGVGKTSLLESIELHICGATARSGGKSEAARFGMRFRGSSHTEPYRSRDNSFYRTRDSVWYGNAYSIGNSLCEGFRHFNFFDSDAAYRLSVGSTPEEVQAALRDLFLGREASWVQERVAKIAQRFEGELNARNKEIEAYERTVRQTNEELAKIKASLSSEAQLLDSFRRVAEKSSWLGGLPSADVASLHELRGRLDAIYGLLSSMRASLPWLPLISQRVLATETKRTSEVIRHLRTLDRDLLATDKASADSDKELDRIGLLDQKVNLIAAYICDPDSGKLHGLSDSILRAQRLVDVLSAASMESTGVTLGRYSKLSESLANATERIQKKAATLSAERASLADQVEDARGQHSQVQRVIAEITAKAQEFLELVPDADICPLCRQEHGARELVHKINKPHDQYGTSERLAELIAQHEQKSKEHDVTKGLLSELAAIRSASSILLRRDDLDDIPLQQLASSLSEIGEKLAGAKRSLADLKNLQDRLSEKRLREDEYNELLRWFAQNGYTDQIDLSSIDGFSESQNALVARRAQLLAEKEERAARRQGLQRQKAESLASYWRGIDLPSERKANLDRVMADLEAGTGSLSTIGKDLSIDADEDLANIGRRAQQVQSALALLTEGLEKLHASEAAQPVLQEKLTDAREQLSELEPMRDKLVSALEVLRSIGRQGSSSEDLCRAIECSRTRIAEIYRRIHAPREFVDVLLDNGISLLRAGSDEPCPLTQVSTGQRSALALSIFLSMNDLLTDGPPYVILDDVVAHTDDLNILSFFDYLLARTLDPDRKRQIFFATASRKIGNLFRMKFEGLGDDMFGVIDLGSYS